MAAEILMVPIQLDALYLKKERSMVETMADFSRLPYCDGKRDINPDVANLSEEILSQPFQDRSLQLKAGVHLHWALPDALTRGFQKRKSDHENKRPVPNRWLVTRTTAEPTQCKQWVVESDYLSPPGQSGQQSGISYPDVSNSHPQPFRYLGRKLPLALWRKKEPAQYLDIPLTALGYGEPTFAAFYPNCLSVFGFHDDAPPQTLRGVQYDVLGWYSEPEQDCLRFEALLQAFAKEKYDALKEVYQWEVEHAQGSALPRFPTKTICYAHLTFATNDPPDNLPEERKVAIALGNTGTEALSAYLADFFAKDRTKQAELEDQLEAIHLAGRFEGRKLDIGPKFKEARHDMGFTGLPAGTLWLIRLESAASAHANAPEAATVAQDTLPPALADQLHCLNVCQQAYDRDCEEVESLRKQLFADWYKYMLCVYPPDGNRDQYPNHDEVKYFIEKNSLFPLQQRIAKNKALNFQRAHLFRNLYQAVAELQLLTIEDILDWAKFQKRFQSPRSAPIEHISTLLAEATRSLATSQTNPLPNETKKQIVDNLNDILRGTAFSKTTVFGDQALAGEAQNLIVQLTKSKIADWPYDQLLRLNRLLLEAAFPEEITKNAPYALKALPAPRYWQPKEPVVLIVDEVGQTVKPSSRHGRDAGLPKEDRLLKCQVIELPDAAIDELFDQIRKKIIGIKPSQEEEGRPGFTTWKEQPWHPFLLEWEVEVMPLRGKYRPAADLLQRGETVLVSRSTTSPQPLSRAYDSDCITENYELNENEVDAVIRAGRETVAKESNCYYGRSILTPQAKLQLVNQIRDFLAKRLLDDYYNGKKVKPEERTNDEDVDAIIQWYQSLNEDKKDAFVEQILPIYQYLTGQEGHDSGFHLLAQSLSGFNEALLMQKQTLQLPINDPLAFTDYQSFTNAVCAAVGRSNRTAPQPHNDFNPIRTGILKINQLRLVDTFGQVQTLILQDNEIITTDVMTTPASPHLAILPPRIVQPARLNFRWLAADEGFTLEEYDDPEMNSHPASTPICGWLLANNLQNSLMVYDARGRALGSLNQAGGWEPAPGGDRTVVVWPLPNAHLHKVIVYLQEREKQDKGFLSAFLSVIENALESIDPEYAGGHEALALLMGRPIAVVRATLNLEVQGYPAIDQDWNAFRQDLDHVLQNELKTEHAQNEKRNRETEDYTKVAFPIRIGEYQQLDDGLIGYWIEEGDHYQSNTFYAPQSSALAHPYLAVHRKNQPLNILQSISSPPQKLTLLLDPRGVVHATSGILPTKAIHIPADQFLEALRNIEVTFLSAPILTERDKMNLPLPDEPGYVWSWCEKDNGVWESVTQIGQLTTGPSTAPKELREGWLKLTAKDRPSRLREGL
jgi:hypothetical protein